MMSQPWRGFLAIVAGVFLSAACLTPRQAAASSYSSVESGQDTADLLMYGALGIVAVALIIQIVKSDSEPAKPDDATPESKQGASRDGIDTSLRGAQWRDPRPEIPSARAGAVMIIGGLGEDGALVGLRLGL